MRGRHMFGFGRGGERGFGPQFPRVRRGDMKYLLLEILKKGPRHGYEIISELENDLSGYRASPGSVYPTLQMLEEGGYLTSEQIDGKKVYTITDDGIKLLGSRGSSGFEETPEMKRIFEVRRSFKKLAAAVMEGARGTDEASAKRIVEILDKARKDVYAILAEG